jgi:hypothetical protein
MIKNLERGFYQVGDRVFTNKMLALYEASKSKSEVKFLKLSESSSNSSILFCVDCTVAHCLHIFLENQ